MSARERQRDSRTRQRDRERDAVADPANADDMTLARLIARAAAGIKRGGPMRETLERAMVKYCRELCDRYETDETAGE
jgi:hypothetical protein